MNSQYLGVETIAVGVIILAIMTGLYYFRRILLMRRYRFLIGAAMDSYRITPADAAEAGLEKDLYKASQRCSECPSTGPCRNWLAFGLHKRLEQHCQNLEFFRAVRGHKNGRDRQTFCSSPSWPARRRTDRSLIQW